MKRTVQDIRDNIDHVGCDNATALEMCDEIDNLRAALKPFADRVYSPISEIGPYRRAYDALRAND